jgi:Ricin-type beta-trefoil lectin domain-like
VVDPANPDRSRYFSELERRENDLRNLVNGAPVLLPVFGNYYTLRFYQSSKCLDSAGNTTNDNDVSQLYTCHGNGNQRLALTNLSNGVYSLKYKHSGKCVDVQNGSSAKGARVVQRTCDPARASQKLTLSALSGQPLGTPAPRVLRFQHSSLCLLVQNQGTADSTAIVQDTCPTAGQHAKAFHLVE